MWITSLHESQCYSILTVTDTVITLFPFLILFKLLGLGQPISPDEVHGTTGLTRGEHSLRSAVLGSLAAGSGLSQYSAPSNSPRLRLSALRARPPHRGVARGAAAPPDGQPDGGEGGGCGGGPGEAGGEGGEDQQDAVAGQRGARSARPRPHQPEGADTEPRDGGQQQQDGEQHGEEQQEDGGPVRGGGAAAWLRAGAAGGKDEDGERSEQGGQTPGEQP